jgi:Domain of unknown function (DUF4167)
VRQGQQNRRGRGRNNQGGHSNNNNNNNRKHGNPLSRSFESNGPDVKIRGTPAHIAEKYMTLARDAQMSGDPVLAENYLQHAEHYNRIIMAYREQLPQQGGEGGYQSGQPRPQGADGNEMTDEEAADMAEDAGLTLQNTAISGGPQHQGGGQRFDNDGPPRQDRRPDYRNDHRQPRFDRNDRNPDRDRQGFQDRPDRGGEAQGQGSERQDRYEGPRRDDRTGYRDNRDPNRFRGRDQRPDQAPRSDRPDTPREPREAREYTPRPPERTQERTHERSQDRGPDRSPERQPDRAPDRIPERTHERAPDRPVERPHDAPVGDSGPAPRRRERYQAPVASDQPEFLRRPVRRPRAEEPAADVTPTPADEPSRD